MQVSSHAFTSSAGLSLQLCITGRDPAALVAARRELEAKLCVHSSASLVVPRDTIPFIIGKGGSVLRAIQESTQCAVTVPSRAEKVRESRATTPDSPLIYTTRPPPAFSGNGSISDLKPSLAVDLNSKAQAQVIIDAPLVQVKNGTGAESASTEAAKEKTRHAQDLAEEAGETIDEDVDVILTGAASCIKHARSQILAIVADRSRNHAHLLRVPMHMQGFVRHRSKALKCVEAGEVVVHVPARKSAEHVELTGPREQVRAVAKEMADFVREIVSRLSLSSFGHQMQV